MVYAGTECAATVSVDGKTAAPAEKLRAAVDKCGPEIDLQLDGACKLTLNSGGCHYEIACLNADIFPAPFGGSPAPLFSLGHGMLPSIVKSLKHAVCSDEQKFNLCGIHMVSKDGRITACATDGHRLSVAARDIVGSGSVDTSFTIPSKACSILSGINCTVDLAYSPKKNMVQFDAGKTDLYALLQEGEFPNYRAAIPQNLPNGCTVIISALIEALEACGVMGDDKNKSVQLSGSGGCLKLTTLGATGTATMTIPYMGEDGLELRLNSKYLLQAAKSLGGEELFLKYGEPLSPIMLIPVDHEGWDERLEVIMQLRS